MPLATSGSSVAPLQVWLATEIFVLHLEVNLLESNCKKDTEEEDEGDKGVEEVKKAEDEDKEKHLCTHFNDATSCLFSGWTHHAE